MRINISFDFGLFDRSFASGFHTFPLNLVLSDSMIKNLQGIPFRQVAGF